MIVWALLLIPIILCFAKTINLYAYGDGIEGLQYYCGEDYYYSKLYSNLFDAGKTLNYVGAYATYLLIYFLSVIMLVCILSQLNVQSSRKESLVYSFLSIIFYSAIIYAIVYWTSHVMLLIAGGGAASRAIVAFPEVLQRVFLYSYTLCLVPCTSLFFLNKFIINKITGSVIIRIVKLLVINVVILLMLSPFFILASLLVAFSNV